MNTIRRNFSALWIALCSMFFPGAAFASGYGDWSGVAAAMISFGVGIINGLIFLTVIAVHKRYTLWSISKFLLFALLFVLSEALVLALTNFLWDRVFAGDRIFSNDEFYFAAFCLDIIYPAMFLLFMRLFHKETTSRTVWKANGVLGGIVAVVIAVWVIAETVL